MAAIMAELTRKSTHQNQVEKPSCYCRRMVVRRHSMRRFRLASIIASVLLGGVAANAQSPSQPNLPYTAVHDPQFITSSAATFMGDEDRVIGVMIGKTAKAYPAGILSQHGLVEDQTPDGPIAITW
jgi:Protein of unknown function (DUF3179)